MFTLSVTRPSAPTGPASLVQLRSDSSTAIPLGGSTDQASVVLRGVLADPDPGDSLRLEVEVRPVGSAFTNAPTQTGGRVANGQSGFVGVTGLANNTGYHWQARTADQTGRASDWMAFDGNPNSPPDFRTSVPVPPNAPTGLNQLQSDGTTGIPVGGTATARSVTFAASVTDPNPGDQLRLEVEVKPVGTAFANGPSASSPAVANGVTATAAVAGLSDNTAYHWQARTLDQTGRASPWVSFGGNAETATDFRVGVAATQLVFTVQPGPAVAGVAISPAVKVAAQDALGNTLTSFNGDVTVTLASNPGGDPLSGTKTVAAQNGVATFANLSIARAGNGYTIQAAATIGGTTLTVTSAPFGVSPAAAQQLVFTVQPSNALAGAAITPAVQVSAHDAFGNTATGFVGNVTVALGANPGGGALTGTTSVAAVNGAATFSSLSIDKVGSGYTLTASAVGLGAATSAAFAVTAAVGARLVFSTQPSNTTAGAAIAPAVQLTALDASGNTATGFTGTVTVALGTNPGGGTLSGTFTVAAVSGVATFSNLSINLVGTGYTVVATAGGMMGATSAAFNVTSGTATQLVFTVQPTTATAGAAITPAVQVTARDAQGNTATGFTGNVTVAIGTNPNGGTLSGTATVAATAGVASFATLSINKSANGYTLTAAAAGPTSATSAAFAINPGAATQLAFTVQPTGTSAGSVITPAVQVTARDAQGNTATGFTGTVTVAIGANPGGGSLSGTISVAAVAGVVTYGNLSIDRTGTGYSLTAASGGVAGTTSTAFDVSAAAANKLVFTVQPTNTTAGAPITPAVRVAVQDNLGNTVTSFTGNVTVAIGSNPAAGTLAGTVTKAAVAGVVSFPDLSIDKNGAGYTLTAAAAGLTTGSSAAFNVTPGAATQLAFTVQPAAATAGSVIAPAVQVTVRDAQGNTATGFTGNVTVAIGTNPGGGTLAGTTTLAATAGVASFANLSINKSGSGYTLTAAGTGVTGVISSAFAINPGSVSQLTFTVQPTATAAGAMISPAVQVAGQDALGNTVTSFTGNVTVAIGTNPGGGTLAGTATKAAVLGIATFSDLSVNRAGTGYTLSASSIGLAGETSVAFTINSGPPTQLAFTVQPTTATAGSVIAPAVEVTARDGLGNTASGFTGTVTVALGT